MKREAWEHPKLKLVARDLDLRMYAVRGLLESIWLTTGTNFPQGAIRWTAEELAVAIDYPGDADKMVDSLVRRKLLDQTATGWYVHDWHEHADDAVHMRLARNRLRFHNGAQPRLTRLGKDQREAMQTWYDQELVAIDQPSDLVRTDAHVVRTDEPDMRTDAHESALPVPVPVPVPAIEPKGSIAKPTKRKTSERFQPPTPEEVAAYMTERGWPNAVDQANRFCDSYAAKGWTIGKTHTPMKDWRAAVRTWEAKQDSGPNPPKSRRDMTMEEKLTSGSMFEEPETDE